MIEMICTVKIKYYILNSKVKKEIKFSMTNTKTNYLKNFEGVNLK